MYFPYLRGKQFELTTLQELSKEINKSKKIIPIIEPVKRNSARLEKSIAVFNEARMPFVLIANPRVGDFRSKNNNIITKIINNIPSDYDNFYIGYIISSGSTIADLKKFLKTYEERKICLIHYHSIEDPDQYKKILYQFKNIEFNIFISGYTSLSYQKNNFKESKKIIIEDGFVKAKRNADYSPYEYFSDLYKTYIDNGFYGFGDFLIVGEEYAPDGGAAHAVAIHLTYINGDDDIWIRHFVSDRTTSTSDTAGKFLEALKKLVAYVKKNESSFRYSNACLDYCGLYDRQHFPGLGFVKKLSMSHHIELMNEYLKV
jgi:hypothetical protein